MATVDVPDRQFPYAASVTPNLFEMLLRYHLIVLIFWRLSVAASAPPAARRTVRNHESLYAALVPTAFSSKVSGTCRFDSLVYFESLRNLTDWAWTMLDSSGRLSEIYSERSSLMGHFDHCLSARGPSFRGRYCSASLHTSMSTQRSKRLRSVSIFASSDRFSQLSESDYSAEDPTERKLISIGMCIPSSCKAADFQAALEDAIVGHSIAFRLNLSVTTNDDLCSIQSDEWFPHFDFADVAVLSVLALLVFLILTGTIVDVWSHKRSMMCGELHSCMRIFQCFSLIANLRNLFSTRMPNKDSNTHLSCLHGIRFLTMTWVVLGHSWIQGILHPHDNIVGLEQDGLKWQFQVIANATVSVDGFFLLSGLLVSYLLLEQLNRTKGRFNLLGFYLHRYVRLTIVYAGVLAFVSTLLVHLGTGPHWHTIRSAGRNCRRVWYQQLLYINNFIPRGADEQCMTETWYLANDFQLFLLSPLFIYPLWRWRSRGLIALTLVTLLSLVGNVAMFYINQLPPTSMITRPKTMSESLVAFWVYYYPQPWFRSPPYLVGIFTGWLLHDARDRLVCLPKKVVVFGWITSALTGLLVVYGLSPYVNEVDVPRIHPIVSLLYGSFHRFAWSIALAWVIFACTKGYGGWVNQFLSWSAFIPLGRLSYATYLIHYSVINVYYAHVRLPTYYTTYGQFYLWCGHLVTSLLLAAVSCLIVESPFLCLERVIFPRHRSSVSSTEEVSSSSSSSSSMDTSETTVQGTAYGKTNKAFILIM